ncbi:hypothetical protein [Oryzifoliimicrobium ureilyticus]|uniref:hypothetical protein n=1 Tax=Oryzifoliimicrobium ureilyticus TaxID=3113724 RepID=UPI003075FD9C
MVKRFGFPILTALAGAGAAGGSLAFVGGSTTAILVMSGGALVGLLSAVVFVGN